MRRTLFAILLACAIAGTALAHDAKLHKGKPTVGEITAVEPGTGLTLRTAEGTKRVTVRPDTKFEVPGGGENLKLGDRVAVFGTKLPGGEIVAKELVLDEETSASGGAEGHGEGQK